MEYYIITLLTFFLIGIIIFACNEDIKTVKYHQKSSKITGKLRVVVLSDLHGSEHGKKQRKISKLLSKYEPDLILLPGDIIDDRKRKNSDFGFTDMIAGEYPCFYAIGNHEVRTGKVRLIKASLREKGIIIPDKEISEIVINGNRLFISAVDDHEYYQRAGTPERFSKEIEKRSKIIEAIQKSDKSCFSILLSHHPAFIEDYRSSSFDLIVSGHAHGGQVRLPFIDGLFAPGEGFFPKYAGGKYDLGNNTLLVSRGLSKNMLPRVFNRPEFTVLDIEGPDNE